MGFWHDFGAVLVAAVVGGAATGWLGAFVIGLRIPFMGILVSHAAMAGAVYAVLFGVPVFPAALLTAVLVAKLVAWLTPHDDRVDADTIQSILFCLMLGLAFLGMGFNEAAMAPMLALMWGSLLFVTWVDVWLLLGITACFAGFVWVFDKELRALLFSRRLARVAGIRVQVVFSLLLVVAAAELAVNLRLVGGMLIYALMTNPAAGAYRVCRGVNGVYLLAAVLGSLSAVLGFMISYRYDLPTGACIVLVSTALYALCAAYAGWRPGQ